MRFINTNIMSAPDTSNQTSSVIDANQLLCASFHVYFGDSSVNGDITIQASNDVPPSSHLPAPFIPINWVDINLATASIVSGASALLELSFGVPYRWLRVIFTHSSGGSSTININMMAQGA